jgi:tetratricopeptide (TPR) repeat protein
MKDPMITIKNNSLCFVVAFSRFFLFISSVAFAQADSSKYFLQKGLDEKQKGRRMESLKNFEKSFKYDSSNKVMLGELASAYMDLRKYYQAKEHTKSL